MWVMALFSTSFFATCLRVGEHGPGLGHPCHTDTFLVISSVSSLSFLLRFLPCPSHLFYGVVEWAKVSCSFCHWGTLVILAYSWARCAALAAGKGRGWMLLFLLFLHFLSFPSFFTIPLFHLIYYLFYLFTLSLGDDTKWPTRVDVSLNTNTINHLFYFLF